MIIEICANGIQSAQNAQLGGADRIELCTKLAVGGLTPSHTEIRTVVNTLTIETHVLIRPRKGDFIYSEQELQQMIDAITFCKNAGIKGVVSGVLTSEGNIDVEATSRLIAASEGMCFTFHRAFDACNHPEKEIKTLIDLKVDRLLSSGQQHKAIDGLPLLKKLQLLAGDQLEIMPGSGINTSNALQFKDAGFESIHLSATSNKNLVTNTKSFFETGSEGISDTVTIKEVVGLFK